MTQDEIIKIAVQAGFKMENSAAIQAAEMFYKLATAKEREACAKACAEDGAQAMDFTYGTLVGGYFAEIIRARGEA